MVCDYVVLDICMLHANICALCEREANVYNLVVSQTSEGGQIHFNLVTCLKSGSIYGV